MGSSSRTEVPPATNFRASRLVTRRAREAAAWFFTGRTVLAEPGGRGLIA
jgi:hypothetical protein